MFLPFKVCNRLELGIYNSNWSKNIVPIMKIVIIKKKGQLLGNSYVKNIDCFSF